MELNWIKWGEWKLKEKKDDVYLCVLDIRRTISGENVGLPKRSETSRTRKWESPNQLLPLRIRRRNNGNVTSGTRLKDRRMGRNCRLHSQKVEEGNLPVSLLWTPAQGSSWSGVECQTSTIRANACMKCNVSFNVNVHSVDWKRLRNARDRGRDISRDKRDVRSIESKKSENENLPRKLILRTCRDSDLEEKKWKWNATVHEFVSWNGQ
jgi:hypothetical protein